MAVLTVGVVLAATDARAAREVRIALVIGNSDYEEGRLAPADLLGACSK